jgi:hypothetical protein
MFHCLTLPLRRGLDLCMDKGVQCSISSYLTSPVLLPKLSDLTDIQGLSGWGLSPPARNGSSFQPSVLESLNLGCGSLTKRPAPPSPRNSIKTRVIKDIRNFYATSAALRSTCNRWGFFMQIRPNSATGTHFCLFYRQCLAVLQSCIWCEFGRFKFSLRCGAMNSTGCDNYRHLAGKV